MTYDQIRGLEPLPNGTMVEMVNPYDKTVYLERHTDWGAQPISAAPDYEPPKGYRLIAHPKLGS